MSRLNERRGVITVNREFFMPISSLKIPEVYKDKIDSILLSNGLIADRTAKLAFDISRDFMGEPVHLLCVLKGAHTFFSELTRGLQKLGVSYSFDFVKVRSYDGTNSTGQVKIEGCQMETLKGKNVIVVEDIVDTGNTMKALIPFIESYGTKAVVTCVLCEKDTPLSCGYKSNYCGFIVPDYFIVGYGLDYNQAMRDIEHICVINKHGIEFYKDNK